MSEHINHTVKAVGDVISYTVVVGTLMDVLPPIAAILTIIWTLINIYESKTFGRLIGRKDDAEQK
jgi:hypothetical protein